MKSTVKKIAENILENLPTYIVCALGLAFCAWVVTAHIMADMGKERESLANPAELAEPPIVRYTPRMAREAEWAYLSASIPRTAPAQSEPEYEWVSLGEYTLLAYCLCVKCCGVWSAEHPSRRGTDYVHLTASGAVPIAGRTVAVNPRVIAYGTEVWINGHIYVAEDTGGAVRRARIVDILRECHESALEFGRQRAEIWVKAGIEK
ncbi:MAG: 3D domain-containing protein [Oscillospiraceae bacterium]|nr:3D domain-containing protein [Oscillospiraceae bacterium]